MCSVFLEPGNLFDLVWCYSIKKGERFEKELALDGTLKAQGCLFPVSLSSEVLLPKQNPTSCSKDQQLSILINEFCGL